MLQSRIMSVPRFMNTIQHLIDNLRSPQMPHRPKYQTKFHYRIYVPQKGQKGLKQQKDRIMVISIITSVSAGI